VCLNHAEAFVEGIVVLDGDRLGEAAGGDREAVEEAGAAEQDKAVAVPVLDEADLRLPFAVLVDLAVTGVQAQRDRLVAGRRVRPPTACDVSPSCPVRSTPSWSASRSLARIGSAPVSTRPSSMVVLSPPGLLAAPSHTI
jgi:hypothetical protein